MLLYAAIGAAGLLMLFVMLVASSFGDHDVPIHEDGFDHGDLDGHGGPSPLGPRVIGAFLTFFGVGGIIAQQSSSSHLIASGLGIVLGAIAGTIVHRFAHLLHSQQATSGFSMRQLVARPAHVTVAIPENGVGQVRLLIGLEETVQLARSADGKAIGENRAVIIKAIAGTQVVVEEPALPPSSPS